MKVHSIYYDSVHPVHRTWFESVGELKGFELPRGNKASNIYTYASNAKKIPSETDIIICEDLFSVRTGIAYKVRNPGTKVIRLIADEGYFRCQVGDKKGFEELLLHRFLDGGIAVSDFVRRQAKYYLKSPIEVVNPFISKLESLNSIEKNYKPKGKILFIGYNNPNKNIDSLVEAVSDTDYQLDIVGKGHKQYKFDNIETHGFVENIVPYLEKADLYFQPSHGDAFPVSSLESMASATPTAVTENCGTKEIVGKVDSKLVSGTSSKEIRETIEYFYELSISRRQEIGERIKRETKKMSREASIRRFEGKLDNIVR
jgi:glycosyltransferase involved in cell wall biosynthesis